MRGRWGVAVVNLELKEAAARRCVRGADGALTGRGLEASELRGPGGHEYEYEHGAPAVAGSGGMAGAGRMARPAMKD